MKNGKEKKINNNNSKKKRKKEPGLAILFGLHAATYSRAQSHYCSTRRLLPAAFPPWAGSSLIKQPGYPGLRQANHIGAELSVDARSPQSNDIQDSRTQTIHQPRLPCNWITGARHNTQPLDRGIFLYINHTIQRPLSLDRCTI